MDIEHPEFLLFLRCAEKNKLRYMCIGGYAVNYYGYHRVTEDLDIWIAPTVENKTIFIHTLFCMGYTQEEISEIEKEDFTTHFICSLGAKPNIIDILTIAHQSVSFDEAEKKMIVHDVGETVKLNMVPYEVLKEIKSRSRRVKDNLDVLKLEELRKNNSTT